MNKILGIFLFIPIWIAAFLFRLLYNILSPFFRLFVNFFGGIIEIFLMPIMVVIDIPFALLGASACALDLSGQIFKGEIDTAGAISYIFRRRKGKAIGKLAEESSMTQDDQIFHP